MIPKSIAGRLQLIQELLDENEYDDDGNIVGKKEPLITPEEARKLLGFNEEIEDQ
jgi:hypothetical protein